MKFSKPINREVEIDGQNFIVSFDDNGIEFRLKGKRKTARVAWPQVLDSARGEDGSDARSVLGLGASTSASHSQQKPAQIAQNEDALASTLNSPTPQSQPDGSAQAPPSTAASSSGSSSPDSSSSGDTDERSGDQGRAVTAGDIGPES
jgi:hypothetical protein